VQANTPQNPYFFAENSRNIKILGAKTETDGVVFSFSNCDNISVNAILTHVHLRNKPVDPAIVELKNGTKNVELAIVFCPHPDGVPMIRDEMGNLVKRNDFLGLYKLGDFKPALFGK